MNIWFDILHTPQYNFYRPIMKTLAGQGHTIYVTVLGRGRTPQIMQHELSGEIDDFLLDFATKVQY